LILRHYIDTIDNVKSLRCTELKTLSVDCRESSVFGISVLKVGKPKSDKLDKRFGSSSMFIPT